MVLEGTARPKVRVQPVNRPDGSTQWSVNFGAAGQSMGYEDTKSAAVKEGRKIARERNGQLIIYNTNLEIQRTHDYS